MYNFTKLFASFFVVSLSSALGTGIIDAADYNSGTYPQKPLQDHQEKQDFMSIALSGVKNLDLSNKNLQDKDIQMLSFNESSGSIINIDLSGNKFLTCESIRYISESFYLGSIRNIPQISDSCGLPATAVYVNVKDTGINRDDVRKYDTYEGCRKNFNISYIHPFYGSPTFDPVDYGVKFVECRFY